MYTVKFTAQIEYVFDTSAKAGLRKEFDEYLYTKESVPQTL